MLSENLYAETTWGKNDQVKKEKWPQTKYMTKKLSDGKMATEFEDSVRAEENNIFYGS